MSPTTSGKTLYKWRVIFLFQVTAADLCIVGNTAYGIHSGALRYKGIMREVFSRADKVDNAFDGVYIATD